MDRNPLMRDELINDFYIFTKSNGNWAMPDFHFHEGFEIYFVVSGEANIYVENRVYPVKSGDLLVFNHRDFHRIDATKSEGFERYVIMFNPDYIQALSAPEEDLLECFLKRSENFIHLVRLDTSQHQHFISLINKMKENETNRSFGQQIYKKLILAEILIFVNQLFRAQMSQDCYHVAVHNKKVEELLEYISSHLNEDLSLERLSVTFYLSKCHIQNLFKKNTGFNIHEYILIKRILKARELLRKDYTVLEISGRVGFSNCSSFIRAFKKLVGASPKKYASRNRRNAR